MQVQFCTLLLKFLTTLHLASQGVKRRLKMANLTKHFTIEELMCPCCKVLGVRPEFIVFLERVRAEYANPMKITSAFRCEKQNSKVGGSSTSAHMVGLACDVLAVTPQARLKLIKAGLACGVKGLGIAKTFVHLDLKERDGGDVAFLY